MTYQFLNDLLDETEMRDAARRVVGEMAIVTGAERGDPRAFGALLSGWWYYVTGFDHAIAGRMVRMLQSGPLERRYGAERTRAFRRGAFEAVTEMHLDEGSHAAMWEADAKRLRFPLPLEDPCRTVKQLLSNIVVGTDPVPFWGQLAATEYIAECVTERLHNSPAFMERFFPAGWKWGEAHILHEGELSHRAMDLDIALAYAAEPWIVRETVVSCLDLFAWGSDEVADRWLP